MRNYDSFKAPTHFKLTDLLKKFDKTFGATKSAENYGKVDGDRTMADIAKRRAGSLELPVHRRHVVPGSVQLRLPPHRDVHHPVCDAAGRDLLLRLQHRHRLAQHHREDAHDGDAHQVVRGARPPRDLRRRQDRAARLDRALAEAERRGGRAPARRPTSTTWASRRTRAKRSCARAQEAKQTPTPSTSEMAKLYRQHVLKEAEPSRSSRSRAWARRRRNPCRKCCTTRPRRSL